MPERPNQLGRLVFDAVIPAYVSEQRSLDMVLLAYPQRLFRPDRLVMRESAPDVVIELDGQYLPLIEHAEHVLAYRAEPLGRFIAFRVGNRSVNPARVFFELLGATPWQSGDPDPEPAAVDVASGAALVFRHMPEVHVTVRRSG